MAGRVVVGPLALRSDAGSGGTPSALSVSAQRREEGLGWVCRGGGGQGWASCTCKYGWVHSGFGVYYVLSNYASKVSALHTWTMDKARWMGANMHGQGKGMLTSPSATLLGAAAVPAASAQEPGNILCTMKVAA